MPLSDRFRAALERRRQYRLTKRQTGLDRRLVQSFSDRRMPTRKQLKHLPKFLSPAESTAVRVLLVAAALSLGAMGTRYASEHISAVPADGGEYVEASVSSPRLINPVLASGNDADLDLSALVFSGLVKTDATGAIVPDLAESFEVSADGKTYVFRLREGVVWHDGAPFTASDVLFTINTVKDPTWKSPLASRFRNVAVTAQDDRTVTLTLEQPFAPFLSLLMVGIIPEHLWQDVKPENAARAELNTKPVGTGPFKFKSFSKDKKGAIRSYTLDRNDKYHSGRPRLERITFKFYSDFASALEAMTDRKADGVSFLPREERQEAESLRWIRTYSLRLPQYTAVFFNPKKNEQLTRGVRQALSLAIDRDAVLAEGVGGAGGQVYGPVLPGFIGFHPEVKKYRYAPAEAGAILDKEGWRAGGLAGWRAREVKDDKRTAPGTELLALKLVTADTPEYAAVAAVLKKNWEAVGAKVTVEAVSASKIQNDSIRTREYDALLYGEIIGPDPDPYPFWHSSQTESSGLNLAMFNHRRADELLEKARLSVAPEERAAFYREFQDILAEESPASFLYSPTYAYAVSRRVQGMSAATVFAPSDRFTGVTEWYVETKRVWR